MRSLELKSSAGWFAALLCALAGAVVFQFFGNANHGYIDTGSLFWWWIHQWTNPGSETEHGWLILGIAAWLFVRALRDGPSSPDLSLSRSAVLALAGGLALHAVGFAAQQARLSIVALLLFTWGVLRLGGGRRWGAAAAFPLAFMVFAIPVNVLDSVGFWLRVCVVNAGTAIAHVAGIDVIQNGTQLVAPDRSYNYDVAAACSGVRSLVALSALSLLIGYLNFRSWWLRAAMLLLCLPLVYVGNVARIAVIIFAAEAGGPRWGDIAHTVMGYVIFLIVLGGVLGAAAVVRRISGNRHAANADGSVNRAKGMDTSEVTDAPSRETPSHNEPAGAKLAIATAVGVLLLALGEMLFLHHLATLPPRGGIGVLLAGDGRNPVELPAFLGRDWVGWPSAVTKAERDILPPDTGYSRMNYVPSRKAPPVFLSIVLSGRDRTSIHRPELCLLGQGWTTVGRSTHAFSYPGSENASFRASVLRVERRNPTSSKVVPHLVAYWFVGGDRVVATHWERLAWDAWQRLVYARADRWAYVLIQTDAADGDDRALVRIQSVLDATLPTFQRAVPKTAK